VATVTAVDPVEVDHRPARLSGTLAVVAAALAALSAAAASQTGLVVGLASVALVAVGVAVGGLRTLGLGAAGAFVAALLGGVDGASAPLVVAGVVGALLAWDLGEQAVNVGQQVGRSAPTRRGELGHAAASVAVGATAAVGAVSVYRVATGGLTTSTLALLGLATLLLIGALRR
jgi:hypothetical protein